MDARKVKKMNKICDKITEAVLPVGMQPDFKQFREGKGNEFTMTIKFTDKQKDSMKSGSLFQEEK
jgi:hypothetical protein